MASVDPGHGVGTGEDLAGQVLRVRTDRTGPTVSLYAALQSASGDVISFYMRGREVRGIVESGDQVRLEGVSSSEPDGLRATHLANLTTHSQVSVWDPPLYRRMAGWLVPFLASAIIGPILGGLVAAAIGLNKAGSKGAASPPAPGEAVSGSAGSSNTVAWIAFGAVALIAGITVFYLLYVRPHRRRRAALMAASDSRAPGEWPEGASPA